MGYFLRSSVAKNPSNPEFKPGRTVEPVLAPPGFDFLGLIRACIPQSCGPIGEEDLGVDRDNPDFGSSGEQIHEHILPPMGPLRECAPTHKQTRDNVRRRRNRERRRINCGLESNAEVQTAASFPLNALPIIAPTLVSEAPPLASPSTSPLCPSPLSLRNSKRAEKRKRKAEREPVQAGPSKRTIAHVLSAGTAIEVDLEARDFDAAHGAHTAKPGTRKQRGSDADIQRCFSVEELVALGFRHIPWDGLTPYPLIDPLGRVIGVLAGTPGSGYAEDLLRASDLILQEGKQAGLGAAAPNPHLRGSFPAYNCGVTMGMGSPRPVALNPKALTVVLARLVGHETVLRMAMYQNRAFSIWAPRVYAVYEATQTRMYEELPTLPRNFPA